MAVDTTALDAAIDTEAESRIKSDLATLLTALTTFSNRFTTVPTMDGTIAGNIGGVLGIIASKVIIDDAVPSAADVYGDGSFPANLKATVVGLLEADIEGETHTEEIITRTQTTVTVVTS